MTLVNYEPMIQTPQDALDELDDMIDNYDQDCDIATAFFESFDNKNDPRHYDQKQAECELNNFKNYYKTLDDYQTYDHGVLGAVDLLQQYETSIAGHLYTRISKPAMIANCVDSLRAQTVLRKVLDLANLTENDNFTPHNSDKMHKAIDKLRHDWLV